MTRFEQGDVEQCVAIGGILMHWAQIDFTRQGDLVSGMMEQLDLEVLGQHAFFRRPSCRLCWRDAASGNTSGIRGSFLRGSSIWFWRRIRWDKSVGRAVSAGRLR